MTGEDRKQAAFQALTDRVRAGRGRAPARQRVQAFDGGGGLPPPLAALAGKVATRPTEVSEADFAAATAAGFTEDQLFELVVCAAVGQAARLYQAGLAALAEATREPGPGHAA